MSDSSGSVTSVKIYNQTYGIRGNDPKHIRRLAELVDHKMCEVAEYTPTVDSAKVAILAALNIADEYISAKEKLEQLENDVVERSEKMNSILERYCRAAT
jgi:cell division protein ZapA